MTSTALVTVVSGEAYKRYAEQLFESAREFFKPTEHVSFHTLEGPAGWPAATLDRWKVLSENLDVIKADFVYLIDADMLCEAEITAAILPPGGTGLVATLHPGYVGKNRSELPYERRPESAASVDLVEGSNYYCGGFVGGERWQVHNLARVVEHLISRDAQIGVVPVWHDESVINRVFATRPPAGTLAPSYCYPDHDDYYRQHIWKEPYKRLIVALDKTQAERGER